MVTAMLLTLFSLAHQASSSTTRVTEMALRAAASVYPMPQYPRASLQADQTGRVVIDVVVAPASNISPLARVQSSRVVETPDNDMANAVLKSLEDARFMPFFDDQGSTAVSSRVVWEFRIRAGRPEIVDSHAPGKAPSRRFGCNGCTCSSSSSWAAAECTS
jgi:outer membrane biosynthesis protein TonB